MSDLTKSEFEEMFDTPQAEEEEVAELSLLDMQATVREVNEANGWWDIDRPFSADIALLHSEVSELFEAMLKNDTENVAEEFADILIRLLDTSERYMFDLQGAISLPYDTEWLFAPGLSYLHLWIDRAYEAYRKHGGVDERGSVGHQKIEVELRCLLSLVMSSAAMMNVDLVAEFNKKIARNRSRGYRHGNKIE